MEKLPDQPVSVEERAKIRLQTGKPQLDPSKMTRAGVNVKAKKYYVGETPLDYALYEQRLSSTTSLPMPERAQEWQRFQDTIDFLRAHGGKTGAELTAEKP